VSVSDAKSFMRVSVSDDDDLIAMLLIAARLQFENQTNQALVTQTLKTSFDPHPVNDGALICLPRWPIQSVSAITYIDTNGDEQTWASTEYNVDLLSCPCRLTPVYGGSWPCMRNQMGALSVTYVGGYGVAAVVPADIRQGILMLAAHWYEHRESVVLGVAASSVPQGWDFIVSGHKVFL
jgi:uncharacterized phiE125 gp8 family phage protein